MTGTPESAPLSGVVLNVVGVFKAFVRASIVKRSGNVIEKTMIYYELYSAHHRRVNNNMIIIHIFVCGKGGKCTSIIKISTFECLYTMNGRTRQVLPF